MPAWDAARRSLYPESAVGGYSRIDGTVEFYNRVNALLTRDSEVLDFGAGRGSWALSPYSERAFQLQWLKGRVKRVVGVDVDEAVLGNPSLDEAVIAPVGVALPFPDSTFDLIIADYVLEHIPERESFFVAQEMSRVLRPSGWIAARTPNRRGVIALGGRLVPNGHHTRLLRRLQPFRDAEDVFPTEYAMNTPARLRRLFPAPDHSVCLYGHTSEPTYFGRSVVAWRIGSLLNRMTPPPFAAVLMVFVQKRP